MRGLILAATFAGIGMVLGGVGTRAQEAPKMRVSGPFSHQNLSVYFVHGADAAGPVPLTLAEAMALGKAKLHETGNVNNLSIENTGSDEVFIQAGDIVKGGQQDRVLAVSMVLKPQSGKIDIASFCVEQGRWAKRGAEDVKQFASSQESLPSKAAKLAMASAVGAATPGADSGVRMQSAGLGARIIDRQVAGQRSADVSQMAQGRNETSTRQKMMWDEVAKTQEKLARNLGASVAAPASASSLQLSLENKKVQETRAAYVAALAGKATDKDIVGYVIAINGKIVSGDAYASNGLFKKMWGKQMTAAATEAASELSATPVATQPGIADVDAFLAKASVAPMKDVRKSAAVMQGVAETDALVYVEARRADGGWINRSYIAK